MGSAAWHSCGGDLSHSAGEVVNGAIYKAYSCCTCPPPQQLIIPDVEIGGGVVVVKEFLPSPWTKHHWRIPAIDSGETPPPTSSQRPRVLVLGKAACTLVSGVQMAAVGRAFWDTPFNVGLISLAAEHWGKGEAPPTTQIWSVSKTLPSPPASGVVGAHGAKGETQNRRLNSTSYLLCFCFPVSSHSSPQPLLPFVAEMSGCHHAHLAEDTNEAPQLPKENTSWKCRNMHAQMEAIH